MKFVGVVWAKWSTNNSKCHKWADNLNNTILTGEGADRINKLWNLGSCWEQVILREYQGHEKALYVYHYDSRTLVNESLFVRSDLHDLVGYSDQTYLVCPQEDLVIHFINA